MKKVFIILLTLCVMSLGACSNVGGTPTYYLMINRTDVALEVGDKFNLVANYGDDSEVITFTSENENVATVNSDGCVTAVGVGSTYIVVSVENETKVCLVNVSQHDYSIQLNYEITDYIIVGAQLRIDVILYKDGNMYEGNVSAEVLPSQGASITALDKSTLVFNATESGEYNICVSSEKAKAEITVTVKTAEQVD
jgi:hypothetical protein